VAAVGIASPGVAVLLFVAGAGRLTVTTTWASAS